MESNSPTHGSSPEALDALRQEVVRLQQRIAALEPAPATTPVGGEPESAQLDVEVLAVISAALAAYLGVKPHIRQVTLLGGASWAQQGRVTIQASHALQLRHDQE